MINFNSISKRGKPCIETLDEKFKCQSGAFHKIDFENIAPDICSRTYNPGDDSSNVYYFRISMYYIYYDIMKLIDISDNYEAIPLRGRARSKYMTLSTKSNQYRLF